MGRTDTIGDMEAVSVNCRVLSIWEWHAGFDFAIIRMIARWIVGILRVYAQERGIAMRPSMVTRAQVILYSIGNHLPGPISDGHHSLPPHGPAVIVVPHIRKRYDKSVNVAVIGNVDEGIVSIPGPRVGIAGRRAAVSDRCRSFERAKGIERLDVCDQICVRRWQVSFETFELDASGPYICLAATTTRKGHL